MGDIGPPPITLLLKHLSSIKKCPLKPIQKLVILKQHCIPMWVHALQNTRITKGFLLTVNRLMRLYVKHILHLPKSSANAFLLADCKDGVTDGRWNNTL